MNKDMTREEAIARIKDHKNIHKIYEGDPRTFYISKALDMAIESLEQESQSKMISEEKGQCIYRQEAIDAFQIFREYESNRSSGEWVDRIETVLNRLQPVTPQSNPEDIAKAFQIGLAIGFGERYDELDRVIDEIKKVINKQNKKLENQLNASVQNVIDRESEERNLCDSCITKGCIFQSGIVRNHCDFYKGIK